MPLIVFLVAQTVMKLPTMQETWVRFLGQKDPLEEVMATHSSILAWRISWTEEPGGLQSMGPQSRTNGETEQSTAHERHQMIFVFLEAEPIIVMYISST